ncbi:MAG: peptidylprolyl isomerase [Dehalococcoidales bacterium]|nr:peptidylprolyl isomerase [Dehalococcoidales bacterium]
MTKKRPVQTTDEAKPLTEEAKRRKKKTNTIITVASILVAIAIVVSVGYYLIYVMPMHSILIKVNDESIRIDYFLKRCLLNGTEDVYGMVTNVTYEVVIKQAAAEYGIVISEAEIDEALRSAAKGSNESISEAEFQEWYGQKLYTSMLSDKEFREIIRSSLIAVELQAYLEENVPATAEQVHLHYIYIADYEGALEIQERIDNGEDFATIAREVSLDTTAIENGGDQGWVPVHALTGQLEYLVAGLTIGEVSAPFQLSTSSTEDTSTQPYMLVMISERAPSMEVSEEYMQVLKSRALNDWLEQRLSTQTIRFYGKGTSGGYDSETQAWLQYQLTKMRKAAGLLTTTTATE